MMRKHERRINSVVFHGVTLRARPAADANSIFFFFFFFGCQASSSTCKMGFKQACTSAEGGWGRRKKEPSFLYQRRSKIRSRLKSTAGARLKKFLNVSLWSHETERAGRRWRWEGVEPGGSIWWSCCCYKYGVKDRLWIRVDSCFMCSRADVLHYIYTVDGGGLRSIWSHWRLQQRQWKMIAAAVPSLCGCSAQGERKHPHQKKKERHRVI